MINWEVMRSASRSSCSYLVTSHLSVWSCVVGKVVVVVFISGRAGCLSLLRMKSLSTASQFKVSSAVRQVMSLVRSLLSLLDLSGGK